MKKGFRFLAALLPLATTSLAVTAPPGSTPAVTTNFKDADITMVAEAVGAATGKNFIIDPRVRAQVTMLTTTPLSPAAFYQAFLSILEVYGFNAEPAGDVIKIVPDANAKQHPGLDLPDHIPNSDEFVTEVVDVRNVSATQLVPILRPLIPQYGQLAAYPASNILIISDRASNVARMIKLIRKIDVIGDQDVEMMQLQNASATEVVRVVNSLYQNSAAQGAEPNQTKLAADDRSNSVLISGDQQHRLRLRALVANLDTPLKATGDTQVRYLRFADASKLAPKLKEEITGMVQQTSGGGGGAAGAAAPTAVANAEKNSTIWADEATNSLVVTAPPKIMKAVMSIVDKLDIRRPQVEVEAIIADMDSDRSASLGVNWASFSKNGSSNIPVGAFVSPIGPTGSGTSIVDLAQAIENPAGGTLSTSLLQGATFGVGKLSNSGLSFAAILRALRSDSTTNIISTPSTITLDNQEAEMKSAEEVPFVTGSFASTGVANTTGQVNPFQTIQREDVGTSLKVTPTIAADGKTVQLKISIEDSSLGTKPPGAVDLVTNKRAVTTTVRIEDGGVVVLGGLTKDSMTKEEDRVPFLGNIPLIGLLFQTRTADHTKNNLMIFIKPHIINDAAGNAYETDSKYKYMLDEEKKNEWHELLPILPFEKDPKLPKLPPAPVTSPDDRAPASVEEKEQAAREEARKARQDAAADAAAEGLPPPGTPVPAKEPPSPVPQLPPAPPR